MQFGSMIDGTEFLPAEHRWKPETVDMTNAIVAADAEKKDYEILELIGEQILVIRKHAENLIQTVERAIDAGGNIFEASSKIRLNASMKGATRMPLLYQADTETLSKQIRLHQTSQTRAYESAAKLLPDLQKVLERGEDMIREFSETSVLSKKVDVESWSEMIAALEHMRKMDATRFDRSQLEKLIDVFDGVRLLLQSQRMCETDRGENTELPQCKYAYGSIEDPNSMSAIEQIFRATGQEHLCGSELVRLSKNKYLLYQAHLENMLAGCVIVNLDSSKSGFIIDAFGVQPLMKGQGVDIQLLSGIMEKLRVQKRDFIRIVINESDVDLRMALEKLSFKHSDYLPDHFPSGKDGYEMEFWHPDALKCERTSREVDSEKEGNDNRRP